MTVLVIALGSMGDVHPNIGLALALKRRGHNVVLVTNAVFKTVAQREGIMLHPLGTEQEFYDAIRDPDLWHPYRAFFFVARRMIVPLMREVYRIIESYSEARDTIVTAPATAFGARIAQEKLRVPLATIHLQPAMLRSVYESPVLGFPNALGHLPRPMKTLYLKAVDRFIIDPQLASEVNAFRAELDLPPVRRFFDRWMHSPQLVLGLFPSWFSSPQPDWPPNVHVTGFPLYDENNGRPPVEDLKEFLEAGDPPVVFTIGSANAVSAEFFRISVETCAASDLRAVLLTQFPEQLPPRLPENIRAFDYVPFSSILPRAAALVHHGGIGTTAQALAAGIPQLVVPSAHDQPDNAMRVRRLGVGDFLLPRQYKTAVVTKHLKQLMESADIHENCRIRARNIAAMNPLDEACNLIEQTTGNRIHPDKN